MTVLPSPTSNQPADARPALAPRVRLLGTPIDAVTRARAVEIIAGEIAAGRGGWVVTPNLDILRRLSRDRSFRDLCAPASLMLPDGMPLIWASRLQRTPIPERVAGSDLIWSLSERAGTERWRVYFLGGNPGTAEGAAAQLARTYPGLVIAGTHCPPIGFESDPAAMNEITRAVADAAPQIVFVALGSPKQERVIRHLLEHLGPSASPWFLGIGISFSFVVGEVKRAPRILQRVGLEWLHRLVQEPRRLARRYIVDGLPFAARLWTVSLVRGVRGRASGASSTNPDNPG